MADYKGRESIQAGEAFDTAPAAIDERTLRGQLTPSVQYAFLPKTRGASVNLMLTLRYGTPETLQARVTEADILPQLMAAEPNRLTFNSCKTSSPICGLS
ncbi:MAG: hypothetical protein R3C05_29070 [Pirellulaceae bacterium]